MNIEAKTNKSGSLQPDIGKYFKQLQETCGKILQTSLSGSNKDSVAASLQFCNELEDWRNILCHRRETELLEVAEIEYLLALLALTQGHYRHAFKGLRLVLELTLQAVYLSMNEVRLREWFDNRVDTVWSSIVNQDEGIFSPRVAKAFFPDLAPHINHYCGLSQSIYRECSECVHGNTPKYVPLRLSLTFDQAVFDLWHSKAKVVVEIVHFSLSLRYLLEMSKDDVPKIATFLFDHVGHLTEIRNILGGPTKG